MVLLLINFLDVEKINSNLMAKIQVLAPSSAPTLAPSLGSYTVAFLVLLHWHLPWDPRQGPY
jgi:hypothetical protein